MRLSSALLDLYDIRSALLDLYDIRNSLSEDVKNQPKDSEGSEITIGDCLTDVIETIEGII